MTTVPGSNLLNQALGIIGRQSFLYFAQLSRTTDVAGTDIGQYVSTYATAVHASGSVQPMSRALYQQYGLDLQKTYFNFYVSADIIDVTRNVSGDQFKFNGRTFQCESIMPWFGIDGWNQVIAVLLIGVQQ